MKPSEYITFTINRLPKGYVFTYADFTGKVNSKEAIIKALNRMAATGKISKLSKGRFFKPESTPFGNLQPTQQQIVKDLLEENGKTVAYLTGYSIYNQLGLTTQVSNTIQIGKNQVRPGFKRERYKIIFILQKNIITKESIPLLQLLDAMRYIKKIPDTTIEVSCNRLLIIMKEMSNKDKVAMVRLSMKYPPSTRALLGAILEELKHKDRAAQIFGSLNPISKYKLPGAAKVLSFAEKWNIV